MYFNIYMKVKRMLFAQYTSIEYIFNTLIQILKCQDSALLVREWQLHCTYDLFWYPDSRTKIDLFFG